MSSNSNDEEDIISTTCVVAPAAPGLPPSGRNRSHVWIHFVEQPGPEKKAKCNYCGKLIKFKAETSTMGTHLTICKLHPDRVASKRQKASPTTQPT